MGKSECTLLSACLSVFIIIKLHEKLGALPVLHFVWHGFITKCCSHKSWPVERMSLSCVVPFNCKLCFALVSRNEEINHTFLVNFVLSHF